MTTPTPPAPTRRTECKQCAAPNGIHTAFCQTGLSRLLDCLDRTHTFTNTAPKGEKPLWECSHCGEPRITSTPFPQFATGLRFGPARIGGEAA